MWHFVLFFGSIFGPGVMVWRKLVNLNNIELAYSYWLFCSSVLNILKTCNECFYVNKVQSFSWMFCSTFGWKWLSHSWVQECEILCWEYEFWLVEMPFKISIWWAQYCSSIISSQTFTMPAIGINKVWISFQS